MEQQNKIGIIIPFKFKVLFGIVLLVLSVLLVNSAYSYRIFLNDKTSYIFEDGLDKAEEVSDKLISPINESVKKINSFILLSSQNKEQFQKILDSEKRIRAFFYKSKDSEWKKFVKSKKDQDGKNRGIELQNWWKSNSSKVVFKEKVMVNGLFYEGSFYLYSAFEKEKQRILLFLDYSDLVENLKKDSTYKIHIAKGKGSPFFNNSEKLPKYLGDILGKSITKGTKTVENEDGNELLISYVAYPALGFSLISEIAKDKAFAIAKDLINRNIYFGMGVLGIALIIGVFFSSQVTRPVRKLVEATSWIAEGNFSRRIKINSRDEFKVLGNSFNFMSSEIKSMIHQLEEYNKNLEKMVEERTAELKKANEFIETMINSLDQGLMVFDKELQIADIHTKACISLFDTELTGKSYSELLNLDEKATTDLQRWANIVFTGKIPFSSASKLGPQEFVKGDDFEDEDFKHISLEYHPMETEEGISNIVAVATNKTSEIRAIESRKENEAYVEMIMKLIHSKRQFSSFLEDTEQIMETLEAEIAKDKPNPDILLISYHSLNGGFATYSVYPLQKAARSCEEFIVNNRENSELYTNERLAKDFQEFRDLYKDFLEKLENIFGRGKEVVEVDKSLVLYFSDFLQENSSKEVFALFREYFEREAVEEYFVGYGRLIKDFSKKLSKKIAPLKIKGGDTRVPTEQTKEFFNSLVHLFRNCVDHGIEAPSVRSQNNKSDEGKIAISFKKERTEDEKEVLTVIVQDDGGGINPDIIRKKWKEKNPEDKEIDNLSDEKVIYKIFDPTFSTTDTVTEVSGRGVGMSAIKDVIDKKNGTILLKSKVGVGSHFEFKLPLV